MMSFRSVAARSCFALLIALATDLAACSDASVAPLPNADSGSDAGGDDAETGGQLPDGAIDPGLATRVRLVAANTTSGNQQSYELPGVRLFQGLHPDIVMIQEFQYAGGDLRALVDTAFGTDFVFFVEPRTGGIPNGIVSRFPILESGAWADASVPDRAFAYARIDVPGPVDLWAVSVHLLTSGSADRSTEAKALAAYVKSTVPAGDYLVIGGDFNAGSENEQALADLSAEVVVKGPFPADQSGNVNTSGNRSKPHDFVLARDNLGAHEVPVTIGAATFAAGLVFDSRVFTPLTDVAPVLKDDSATTNMQHMPVVRDFMLGGGS
jgi:endonuclease/exonuclease/phosphatase family metal-dependent hydrolase